MELLIFIVGFIVFIAYVMSFSFFEKDKKTNEHSIRIDDAIDYDGHGNWGRFPPKPKKEKKKSRFLR